MNNPAPTVVITSIQEPTPSVRGLLQTLERLDGHLLVIGDKKSPARFDAPNSEFVSLADQLRLPFKLAPLLPTSHYARKNLGYLLALRRGAECIYETDDDNAPLAGWCPRSLTMQAEPVRHSGWVNVYRYFTDEHVWPRGLPLQEIRAHADRAAGTKGSAPCRILLERVDAPIQQGLANGSPDVDAVWRLILDRDVRFAERPSVWLAPGGWCPFNSQSTWWWPVAYPLLYLPSHCSFRMTDIWRSFVAQRCMWALGCGLVFHAAEVEQERNEHSLLRDFEQEIPGYLHNAAIARLLDGLALAAGPETVGANLLTCYEAMVKAGYLPEKELNLVHAWLADLG